MNYLFFDIECAKCEKKGVGYICEFGYIIVNESFEALEKGHFMMDPSSEFDHYAIKNILHYTKEEYRASPRFPEYYERIQELLTREEQRVVGHTTSADIKYIKSECTRYMLPHIKCEYYDIRNPFMFLRGEKQVSSLENMGKKLELEFDGGLHDALYDAKATMRVCEALCAQYGLSMEELLVLKPEKKKKEVKPEQKSSASNSEQGQAGKPKKHFRRRRRRSKSKKAEDSATTAPEKK